jgi:hypothetical protein
MYQYDELYAGLYAGCGLVSITDAIGGSDDNIFSRVE